MHRWAADGWDWCFEIPTVRRCGNCRDIEWYERHVLGLENGAFRTTRRSTAEFPAGRGLARAVASEAHRDRCRSNPPPVESGSDGAVARTPCGAVSNPEKTARRGGMTQ